MAQSDRVIDIYASTRKIEVDNRISLHHYLRIADTLLRQASICREEKNDIDLYLVLIRYSSLMCETIPSHRDYRALLPKEKRSLKKKLLGALGELESLKPIVQRRVAELNRGLSQSDDRERVYNSSPGWQQITGTSSSEQLEAPVVLPSAHEAPPSLPIPLAPPLVEETFYGGGPVHYPTATDSSPNELKTPAAGVSKPDEKPPVESEEDGSSSSWGSCVICLDAPVEGACVPCGHMAGGMSCLNEIKGKGWGCPVCRVDIHQVVRLYAV